MLDVNLNGVVFEGMKLAGTIMIVNGFLLVLLPENWPDYLTRLLRYPKNKTPPILIKKKKYILWTGYSMQMGKTFKSSSGTADNGTCRPENRLHKPIAFEITFGTCQVTVKESKCLRRRPRSKSFHFFSFTNSKMFDAKWETSSVHHSKSLN